MNKKKPTKKIQQDEILELTNKWKRAVADYQNLEKRIEIQQANYVKLASVGLIDKLLPVVDDLERAVEHIKNGGVDIILKQLRGVLESEGVKKIETKDKEFDPNYMDCVEMVEGKRNAVIAVTQEGYMMGEHVIRPVKVEVGTGSSDDNKSD